MENRKRKQKSVNAFYVYIYFSFFISFNVHQYNHQTYTHIPFDIWNFHSKKHVQTCIHNNYHFQYFQMFNVIYMAMYVVLFYFISFEWGVFICLYSLFLSVYTPHARIHAYEYVKSVFYFHCIRRLKVI